MLTTLQICTIFSNPNFILNFVHASKLGEIQRASTQGFVIAKAYDVRNCVRDVWKEENFDYPSKYQRVLNVVKLSWSHFVNFFHYLFQSWYCLGGII